jgi:hypothetical protein
VLDELLDELLSDERLLKPLKDLALNEAPLLPLPLLNERVERSELGI